MQLFSLVLFFQAIQKNNVDGARIYAENAIRQKNQVGKGYVKELRRTELGNTNINRDSRLASKKKCWSKITF